MTGPHPRRVMDMERVLCLVGRNRGPSLRLLVFLSENNVCQQKTNLTISSCVLPIEGQVKSMNNAIGKSECTLLL